MDFNQAVTEVLTITARPDRTAEIGSAINWAISHCCLKGEFNRDLKESTIPISPTSYGETIQFNSVTPTPLVERFRKFEYVKRTGTKTYLSPIRSDKIFTPQGSMQRDVYYIGSNNLTYVLKELSPTLEIAYYQYPPILDSINVPTFWLLEMSPWAVIDLAAARIFRSIGDDGSASAYQRSGIECLKVLQNELHSSGS